MEIQLEGKRRGLVHLHPDGPALRSRERAAVLVQRQEAEGQVLRQPRRG